MTIHQKWINSPYIYDKNIPDTQNNIITDFFNDYMWYYYGKHNYLAHQKKHNRPFDYILTETRWMLAVHHVMCNIINHRKLKYTIIILKMIMNILQKNIKSV
jgi:hypothetical protein